MTTLRPGDPAPPFTLRDQTGDDVSLTDFAGRTLLVYFYPEADTPGCTTQSIAVRDAREALSELGVDAVGISPDEPDAQCSFDEKFSLGFPLLSDPDHAVADAWGTWGEKTRHGKTEEEVIRSSFLVDGDGKIAHAWYQVSAKQTVPNVLTALQPGR